VEEETTLARSPTERFNTPETARSQLVGLYQAAQNEEESQHLTSAEGKGEGNAEEAQEEGGGRQEENSTGKYGEERKQKEI
jgi:hypothetical protein